MGALLDEIDDIRAGRQRPNRTALPQPEDRPQDAAMKRFRGVQNRALFGLRKTGQGMKQLGLAAAEEGGFLPQGSTRAFTKLTLEEREQFINDFNAEFGESVLFDVAEVAGEVAPFLLIPGGGQTAAARVGLGALSGAGAGATQLSSQGESLLSDPERIENTLEGGLVGGAAAPVAQMFPAMKNFFRRRFENSGIESEFAERGRALAERTGVDLKLSQVVDDPFVESMEAFARINPRGERMARDIESRQIQQAQALWQRTIDDFNLKAEFGDQVRNAFDRTMGSSAEGTGLVGARAKQAQRNFAEVDSLTGGEPFIPLTNTLKTLDKLIGEAQTRGSGTAGRALARGLEDIKMEFVNGSASASEMQVLLRRYGAASKGKDQIFKDLDTAAQRRPNGMIFGALQKDLDDAATGSFTLPAKPPGQAREPGAVARALAKARQDYRLASQAIDAVEESAVGKLFGGTRKPNNTEIVDKFIKFNVDDIRNSMKVLESADPQLKAGLQKMWLERKLNEAAQLGPANLPSFSPGRMLELTKKRAEFNAVFDDPAVRAKVDDALEVVQRIIMNNQRRVSSGWLPRVKEALGVMISRDPTFLARFAGGALTPKVIADAAFTKGGMAALREMAGPFNQNRVGAVAAALVNATEERFLSDPLVERSRQRGPRGVLTDTFLPRIPEGARGILEEQ